MVGVDAHDGGTAGAGVPPADRAWVQRLSAVRPEPDPAGRAPDAGDLDLILSTATTVPDHGDLRPWRFVVSAGAGRDRFAEALVAGLHEQRGTDLPEAVVAKMRAKAYAAPCAVLLVASPDPTSNVEVWEQVVSASCTGYAVVLAATGLGYGAVWKSAADDVRAWLTVRGDVQALELFVNARDQAMTRSGFEHILAKHVATARARCSTWSTTAPGGCAWSGASQHGDSSAYAPSS